MFPNDLKHDSKKSLKRLFLFALSLDEKMSTIVFHAYFTLVCRYVALKVWALLNFYKDQEKLNISSFKVLALYVEADNICSCRQSSVFAILGGTFIIPNSIIGILPHLHAAIAGNQLLPQLPAHTRLHIIV